MATSTDAPVNTTPSTDPVKSSTMSSILGLVRPEDATIKPPPPPDPLVQAVLNEAKREEGTLPAKKEVAVAEPVKTNAVKPAAEPANKEPEKTEPAKPAPKKVEVKKKNSIADEVRKAVRDAMPEPVVAKPEPTKSAAPVVEAPDDSDLTPEEREELDTAEFGAARDAKYKDLPGKLRNFYKSQKTFLEDKLAKAAEDGEQYDPNSDPEYKAFLAKNEPKFASMDRKNLYKARIVDEAKREAATEAESKLAPKIAELEAKAREAEYRPVVNTRVEKFSNEVGSQMPQDVVKHFFDNGQDVAKTSEQYPVEAPIILASLRGATHVANEFLAVRKGLKNFDPANVPAHKFIIEYVDAEANVFLKQGGDERIRDGKRFVKPNEFGGADADKTWTFSDEDILELLKVKAGQDAKRNIAAKYAELKRYGVSQPTPSGAKPPVVTQPEIKPAISPRSPNSSLPGVAATTGPTTGSAVSRMLKLG